MRAEREKIVADRERLEREYGEALNALKATPEYLAFAEAHFRVIEHLVLYGTGDLTQEPIGILNMHSP